MFAARWVVRIDFIFMDDSGLEKAFIAFFKSLDHLQQGDRIIFKVILSTIRFVASNPSFKDDIATSRIHLED
jgi:hypothetical protein